MAVRAAEMCAGPGALEMRARPGREARSSRRRGAWPALATGSSALTSAGLGGPGTLHRPMLACWAPYNQPTAASEPAPVPSSDQNPSAPLPIDPPPPPTPPPSPPPPPFTKHRTSRPSHIPPAAAAAPVEAAAASPSITPFQYHRLAASVTLFTIRRRSEPTV
ncbi:hypothetical protein DFH27DRAFT_611546 [Peziza echinospora]|nr:hypothetical protein DFH27DRAFT_611546 [Peziza echinospora]